MKKLLICVSLIEIYGTNTGAIRFQGPEEDYLHYIIQIKNKIVTVNLDNFTCSLGNNISKKTLKPSH